MSAIAGTDWSVDRVVSVTDGDTIRVIRRRTLPVVDGIGMDFFDANPKGVAIRLITLDTPERGEVGYLEAAVDLCTWITDQRIAGRELRIETWPGGGFDRLLGDVYAGDRSNTLSQWMLREKGWLPYVRGQ